MSRPRSSHSFHTWVRDIMSGTARGVVPATLRTALRTIEPAYVGLTAVRNALFDRRIKGVHGLTRPVISVGNLTTGGTGKTPFVQWLVRELIALGETPAVLMRGYARTSEVSESDEERVLRESLPGCPIYADPDRVSAGKRAIAERPATTVFVLDDGFQHRRLARDLDIVLIDATNPLGYGHVLPRGMLRERPAGLRRADLVVLTRVERVRDERAREIEHNLRRFIRPGTKIVRVPYAMDEVRIGSTQPVSLASITGVRAVVLSAIGNPQAFEDGLRAAGVQVVGIRRFADHHAYTQAELDQCLGQAEAVHATLLLTTEKDWATLRDLQGGSRPLGRVSVRALPSEEGRAVIVERVRLKGFKTTAT